MPSDETIAALRSQIDAILQSPPAQSGKRHSHKRRISSDVRDESFDTRASVNEQQSGNSAEDAFKKILALVNASDKSERMIRDRLSRLDFSESAVESAIARAKECGFIDDIRYGDVLVRSRISQGKGSAGIERELYENDIDPYDIPGYPEEFGIDPDSEFDRALSLLERKPPRSKKAREAAYRKLIQKGYPSSVASSAARVWFDAHDAL
ncbi:MAG: regulatory protein RecX [Eggerthellaceae bacterium]|nr:regulatory protein RecX [Eggerthellaceae bacterium]